MKKTYIYKLIMASMLLSVTSSCKKALEISPVDTIEQSKALLTSKDVEVALVGAYSELGSRNLYGGRPFLMADFLANTNAIEWYGTYEELTQTINKSILKTNTFVNNVWAAGYTAINDANNVLSAISKVDAAKKNKVEGEAKFIRGAVYFDLVRLYGKAYNDGSPATNLGVPIVLTPTTAVTDESYVTRATVAAVYAQAIADLTDAEAKLPATNGFFATKSSAAGMLARLYLQMGNYAAAGAAANRVITSGNYSLTSSYTAAFPTMGSSPGLNTTEDVFSIQVTTLTGFNGYNEFYGSSTYGGRGDAVISQSWIDVNYVGADDRVNAFYDDGDMFTSKYANPYGNVSIIRLAEMYLIRAECNVRLAPAAPIGGRTPLQDLSVVRGRAGLTTTSATLANILNERKLELAFEGFALHDAKRTQTNIGSIAWNANNLVFPIPQIEMDANKNLVQNPGYN
ncbi:RagB/SusD family nutrient uptake outer membrane protein [Pedobacter sp. MC2016-05]|uniref:RagB/SusD family nutrient uptake outer membrane protein n=1 Tax=Pedobacter sp. MC2016-05 TaxID=2994474 RepID=UPI00224648AD|nr:RagB/SusD family nutrient uptake outer membrane protein [Pedobacter sp. MC2016-05]MCX2474723.1 RagB/SusD family nutrient uptake outer membrane protein [Pedobacter sp. MC2016-05]